jgi:2-keto-4-pentenoate hydratase/2-oxohepta-3-ene-1,7-dioic acid hydratase in catechol pathway
MDEVTITAPVPRPGKIIAIGMNYRDHCAEQGIEPPLEPLVFAKFPSSVIGPDVAVAWPADVGHVDWEVELAVVVGVGPRGDAEVAGFTIANDVSARDLQARDGQFVRAKSIDTFCPMGPVLVTPDELPDPLHVALSLEVNGVAMQHSNTDQLLFGVPELMSFCRHYFNLEPGDVILTGTPPGVGAFRKPPIYLAPGDVMVARIEGIGELRTPVSGPRLS